MNITIVGARGQLGAAVVDEARRRGHRVAGLTRADCDITDAAATTRALASTEPEAVVNCTADNAVDAAEADPKRAFAVNSFAVRTLARATRDLGAAFVHYSTDFVFDGRGNRPYLEHDDPNPLSVYGLSKLAGESAAALASRHYVLRVASLFGRAEGGPPARGTITSLVRALSSGQTARVFADRIVSPTSVLEAARATLMLLEQQSPSGLYHCVATGSASWLEVAQHLSAILKVPATIETARSTDVVLPAERPQYCALSNDKLRGAGIPMKDWRDALGDA